MFQLSPKRWQDQSTGNCFAADAKCLLKPPGLRFDVLLSSVVPFREKAQYLPVQHRARDNDSD
jgi:hypothetical protein